MNLIEMNPTEGVRGPQAKGSLEQKDAEVGSTGPSDTEELGLY